MKSAICITTSYFLTCLLVLGLAGYSNGHCDTGWIRMVYAIACGKKKREVVPAANATFSMEPLPRDIPGVIQYVRERYPDHPLLQNNEKLLQELLSGKSDILSKFLDPRAHHRTRMNLEAMERQNDNKGFSDLFKKLLNKEHPTLFGIPGFPDHWDIEELSEHKPNQNFRREVDRLVEACCKSPPVEECNESAFAGAC